MPPAGWPRRPPRLYPFLAVGSAAEPVVAEALGLLQVLVVPLRGGAWSTIGRSSSASSFPAVAYVLRATHLGLPILVVSVDILVALFLSPTIMGFPLAPQWAPMLEEAVAPPISVIDRGHPIAAVSGLRLQCLDSKP